MSSVADVVDALAEEEGEGVGAALRPHQRD